ncbi:MAG: uridine kinase family protein [Candidatus Nanopelagicales bacterium]
MTGLTMMDQRVPRNGAYFTVCVDGRGGSGKSTLATALAARLPGFSLVHGDDYFEPHDRPITWGDFNEDRLDADLLAPIRAGAPSFTVRPYDFRRSQVLPGRLVTVDRGVIFERWFGFALPVSWDLAIWVETPPEVCLARGVARDGDAQGHRARAAWEEVWQPREDEYIRATAPRSRADIIVDGTAPIEDQFEWLSHSGG